MLEVALQAEVGIAGDQHLLVHRPVRVVADRAAFHHGVVLEEERALLRRMALRAGLVRGFQIRAAARDHMALVRVVAVVAAHASGQHGVGMRQVELAALVQVAGEAGLGRLAGIDNGALAAARLDVQRAGSVAGLTADVSTLGVLEGEPAVGRTVEVAGLILVALHALLGADIFGACNLRGRHQGSIGHHATDQKEPPDGGSSEKYCAF